MSDTTNIDLKKLKETPLNLQKTIIGAPQQQDEEKRLLDDEVTRRKKRMKLIKEGRQEDLAAPASSLYNLHTTRKHLFNEINHSFQNYQVLMHGFFTGRVFDLSDIPKVKNEPIILIGSGPSLNDAWSDLQRWKGDIMTSTSQASTAVYYGIEPKYVLALDPDSNMEELAVDTWEGRRTTLIAHPGVNSNMFNRYTYISQNEKFARRENSDFWKGRIALFRKLEPQTPFYGNTQKMAYSRFDNRLGSDGTGVLNISSMIKTEIPMMGCVINCMIMAATLMGYNPIYLVGADFGFTNNLYRFDAWHYEEVPERPKVKRGDPHPVAWDRVKKTLKGGWVKSEAGGPPGAKKNLEMYIKSDNGILTNEIMMFYKRNFMNTWRLEQCQLIRCTEGTLVEVPYCPLKTVVDQDGVLGGELKGISKNDIINITEEYLARQNTFLIHFRGGGVQFTEFTDGVSGIMQYLTDGVKRGIQSLDFNGTIHEMKRLAQYSRYMSEKDKKIIESWKELSMEEMKKLNEDFIKANSPQPKKEEETPSAGAVVADAKTAAEKRETAILKPMENRDLTPAQKKAKKQFKNGMKGS